MKKLAKYFGFIRENHLEVLTQQSFKELREAELHLHLSDDALVKLAMKSITTFADSLTNGTVKEIQSPETSPDLITAFIAQKKTITTFIPFYTKDPAEIIEIVNALEELDAGLQQAVFKSEKQKQEELNFQLNSELEAFTYSVSHDLRAPLRAVTGYATILEEDHAQKFDEEGKRLVSMIRYNAHKMGKLIDDLLSFSRLGRKELDKSLENMNELVDGVVREINKANGHHAEIKVLELSKANVDYGLMHQAFYNLIANAVKYSSKKEKPVVEVSSEQKGKEIIYCVKDNGVGFDMKYSDKLFGIFQRLHRSEEFEGTGVGLAVVKRIIAKHYGRIWVDAKPGEGALFCFAIPTND